MFNSTKELGNVKKSTLASILKISPARLLQDIDESLRTRDEFLSLHTSSQFDTPSPVHSNVRFARETSTKSTLYGKRTDKFFLPLALYFPVSSKRLTRSLSELYDDLHLRKDSAGVT